MLLNAISPLDGRYKSELLDLASLVSEEGLIRARITIEVEYLISLSETKELGIRVFTEDEKKFLRGIKDREDILRVKEIEATTKHDVKAIEYYLKEILEANNLASHVEWIHFGITSEDTNNLSHGVIISQVLHKVLLPKLGEIQLTLNNFSQKYKDLSMLARTHGQSASPTTMGKEFYVFYSRLSRQVDFLKNYTVLVKLNGATGNYNAHYSAYPQIDWPLFVETFVNRLKSEYGFCFTLNMVTTQIEPHDTYAELFDTIRRTNTILIDFCQDMWRYISDNWITQKPKEGEVGSSTMPHKINPINFENAEGNLGLANALCGFFSTKLPISRLQRDLSDSTVERNFGVVFGHSIFAYLSILKGLEKISVNEGKVREALLAHPEIIAEAIQTILRREGVAVPYEKLKELTRGKEVTMETFSSFIDSLPVSAELKKELHACTPESYIGIASRIVTDF